MLEWSRDAETGSLSYLRAAQSRALEVYWYLRLIEDTPRIPDLYRTMFPPDEDMAAHLDALGIPEEAFRASIYSLDGVLSRIHEEDDFAREHKLQALRETFTLGYPNYILALAMGAGKTILIGAIVATEFAMALEYPEGRSCRTPSCSRRAPRSSSRCVSWRRCHTTACFRRGCVKLTFTRDGETDVPVVRGSSFNLIVTDTEKIRIQKRARRKTKQLPFLIAEDQDEEIANIRLQTIASLPHLVVFSDEAHHTYGQALDKAVKRVRQTVDYLAASTNVIAVVNTTGTPYYRRQPLRDVIVWYGLSERISDGILKNPAGNIQAYDFEGDAGPYLEHVIEDFFRDYRDVRLQNGAAAKIAIYFSQTDDLDELRPIVDRAVAAAELGPTHVLTNTSKSTQADVDAFNRLNDPDTPYRVILLVNKGTEGWNCPSLFACALARKLRTSNNFVLQAASRCLRQVPGNDRPARIYLSTDNFKILDRQFQETYGETIHELNRAASQSARETIRLRKLDIPPLVMKRVVRTVTPGEGQGAMLVLERPEGGPATLTGRKYSLAEQESSYRVLTETGPAIAIAIEPEAVSPYSAAVELSARYRIDLWVTLDELRRLYGDDSVPEMHLDALAEQIEDQTRHYEVAEEEHEVALALVKPERFAVETDEHGVECYVAEISYAKSREHLLVSWQTLSAQNPGDFD